MIKKIESLGIQKVVELELDQNNSRAYISENGIVSHNCKHCKEFYLDPNDGTYKIYKLSKLLNNGSNYGKKQNAWLPVVGSTHPNTRTSQIIELRPGWKLVSGGAQTFIGLEEWQKYISEKLS